MCAQENQRNTAAEHNAVKANAAEISQARFWPDSDQFAPQAR